MIVQVSFDAQSKLVPILLELLECEELCNFTIKSGNNFVKAHKCILAAALEYFRTSFRFSEASSIKSSIDLSHLNCDIMIIRRVVQSLYNDEIDLSQDVVEGVLHLADYLLYKDLTACVERFMENTLGLNNSIFYFKLCIQYNLCSTSLFANVRRILRGRFHDLLIHEPENIKLDMDVFAAMNSYGMLDNCTPLQLMNFFLNKLKQDLLSTVSKSEEHLISIVDFLETILPCGTDSLTECWNPYLRRCITDWLNIHGLHIVKFDTLCNKLKSLARRFSIGGETTGFIGFTKDSDSDSRAAHPERENEEKQNVDSSLSKSNSIIKDRYSSGDSNVGTDLDSSAATSKRSRSVHSKGEDKQKLNSPMFMSTVGEDPSKDSNMNSPKLDVDISEHGCVIANDSSSSPGLLPSSNDVAASIAIGREVEMQSGLEVSTQITTSKLERKNLLENVQSSPIQNQSYNQVNTDELCPTLVVLSPSSDMASQLMEVEAGRIRPLLKAPRLCLHLYDIQLRVWRESIPLELPIPGYMLEKQSWRVAFANGNLYLFSLGKKIGLEYNLLQSRWTQLSCSELFRAHYTFGNGEEPVRSVIPIAVGDQLVVLSMSREHNPNGTFWTQQHIYQFDQHSKTFSHVTVVRDARMDLPITKWTVKDDELFTLKASTVMYGGMSAYHVQHIHIYNARTRQQKTHHIQSAMKSGLKVLVQAGKLYMLNNLGEYQQIDLSTLQLSEWKRISHPAFTTINSSVYNREEIYPALLRTTCPAGSRRWTLSSQDNIGSASLQEMSVNEEEEFNIGHHPSPPFLYLTAMCESTMKRGFLDGMKQARFDSSSLHLITSET